MNEERIRAITKLYYSNPKVQGALMKFALDREVIPRYFEGFGKRPDTLQYSSDIMGLVNKGATSFHASEELWNDIFKIDSEMHKDELNEIRKNWDLLIDIDSPYLDCSKIAARLICGALEHFGIKNYGIKFSGSKGFHVIVSGRAFPEEFLGVKTKDMFPDWPRAISEFLMSYIRKEYNKQAAEILTDVGAIKERMNLDSDDLMELHCMNCNRPALKGNIVKFKCNRCGNEIERKNIKITSRKLKCLEDTCPGEFNSIDESKYYFCEYCKDPVEKERELDSIRRPEYFEEGESAQASKVANLDLVLVAPRHLFRMPYSLHEKTALASVVLKKEEIDKFNPGDADPLKVEIRDFLPDSKPEEASRLLNAALSWKRIDRKQEEEIVKKKYYEDVKISGVKEEDFPDAIKKLLKGGFEDGRKRALFVLITFLRSTGFDADYINKKAREWNETNKGPLKEGYIRSQIDWHLRQKRKILPPNYTNDSFYKDLGLIKGKQEVKNPIVDVLRKVRKK
jgi:predicted RNA-binding Zn-ribbon protein involved in translation (DUF1610 family)